MRFKLIISTIILSLTLMACASSVIGKKFSSEQVANLKIGVSTLQDAKQLLGEPYQTIVQQDQTIYEWSYMRADVKPGFVSTNVKTDHNQAMLIFDKNNILTGVVSLINTPAPQKQ